MANVVARSFAGGEIAPELHARVDQLKYATGLRTCRNFIVQKQGGVANRPGTEFLTAVKYTAFRHRLIPFIFSASQAYILEFGFNTGFSGYVRILLDGEYIVVGATPAWAAGPYVMGDIVDSAGLTYYARVNHTGVAAPAADPANWHLIPDGVEPNVILELVTPYLDGELSDLHVTQSGDIMTLVHPNHEVQELRRLSANRWTFSEIEFGPEVPFPTGLAASGGSAFVGIYMYVVTALSTVDGEESRASGSAIMAVDPTEDDPILLVWNDVPAAYAYRVYRSEDGTTYGLLGTAVGEEYSDDNSIAPDYTQQPPVLRNPFQVQFPNAVAYFQQRLMFANTSTSPELVMASQINRYRNFDKQLPIVDDSAITFSIRGKHVNAIHHLLDLTALIIFTAGAEYVAEGADGTLLPTVINLRRISENGSHPQFDPLVVSNLALYVQTRGTIVRSLSSDAIKGYDGTDMSVFAAHLFQGRSLVEWAYQQIPHSVVWAVRDDGVLLGLTLIREHEVWGWHRHDTQGIIENVAVIPEGNEDVLYMIVQRNINGVPTRYIERMTSRFFESITDGVFVDCSLTYDGRTVDIQDRSVAFTNFNINGVNTARMRPGDLAAMFVVGDVGKHYIFFDEGGTVILRATITTYISNVSVYVAFDRPIADVPYASSEETFLYALGIKTITGLDHLEGEYVSILADGQVIASPNNPDLDPVFVAAGSITLVQAAATVHIGLPYVSDLQTLDIDASTGPSVKDRKMLINKINLMVEQSRGIWVSGIAPVGDALDPDVYVEFVVQEHESELDDLDSITDTIEVIADNKWSNHGRINVRQVDPLPLKILAAIPQGYIP